MPKSFEHWLDGAGRGETEEVDDTYYFVCRGCGKSEYVSLAEYENGDTGWYAEQHPMGHFTGVCGGSPWCLP